MPRPRREQRPLSDTDLETIRLIARGLTNQQIAKRFGIPHGTFRARLYHLQQHLRAEGIVKEDCGSVMTRVQIVIWAFESGLMDAQATETAPDPAPPAVEPPPAPVQPTPAVQATPHAVPAPLIAEVIAFCEALVDDKPRGDLRRIAYSVLRIAGRRRAAPQRAKPALRA